MVKQEEQKQTLVLVEDDAELLKMMSSFLCDEGYEVVTADDGLQAVNTILSVNPDLVILDIMLPKIDGVEVCRQVRRQYKNPIIMLTAKDDDFVEVASLDQGADSYLTKPVRPHVLLAHVRATLRRGQQPTRSEGENDLNVQDITLNTKTYEIRQGDQLVDVTVAEFDLLLVLVKNAGSPVSRDNLYTQLRGIDYDGLDRAIDMRISALRKKLNDEKPPYRYIKTIRSKGYLFAIR